MNDFNLRESVLHKVTGAQMQHVQPVDFVEFLLKIVQTHNRTCLVGLVRAEAAESHSMLNSCCGQRASDGIADLVLIRAKALPGWTRRRNHRIDAARTGESFGERLLV